MMFPFHRYMDSYPQTFPHHREQYAYPYHYYPSWEAMPPQMKVDSSKPPSPFGPWAYNSHINKDCNGCCSNNYHPGYCSFRPPYPHYQPPPQLYYHGPYPPYPDAYPACFVPPSHNSVDHPRYDHDKAKNHCCGCPNHTCFVPPSHNSVDHPRYDHDKAKNHCCGCPNHTCHQRDDNSLKIEEQKPEEEQKDCDSCKLIQLPNYPHPVVWVPPNFMRDSETNKISDSHPGFWFPLDLNSLKGLRQGGEEKQKQQSEEKKAQAPLPIIWMPSYSKPEDASKDLIEVNPSPEVSKEHPPTVKIIPLKPHENDNREAKPGVMENESGKPVYPETGTEKESKIKTFPVKQMEENVEKKLNVPEKLEGKSEDKNGVAEKRKDENGAKKSSDRKETSPVKPSKLRPVCLRVDPLPRRKTANGTPQSPSPPCHKENHGNKDHTPTSKDAKEESPKKKEIKVVHVRDQSSNKTNSGQKSGIDVPVASVKETQNETGSAEVGRHDDKQKVEEGSNVLKVSGSTAAEVVDDKQGEQISDSTAAETSGNEKMERKGRRNFSPPDAALLIQSVYRGFEVRRWNPLEKLRKIAHIREQVGDVRKQIHNMETCKKLDSKQKVVASETIMNLLLQLDTIQGLHPSVREMRKSVVKELACLQEKLDSLGSQGSQEQESKKTEKDLTERTTDDQVPSFMCPSVESEPNHVRESAEPANEKDIVGQVTVGEIMESEPEKCIVVATEEGQSAKPTLGGAVESLVSLKDEIVPPGNEESKKILIEGESISETGILVESHLVDKEQHSGAEVACKQSVTVSSEPEGALESFSEIQVPPSVTIEHLEPEQVVKCDQLLLQVDELSDSGTQLSQDKKDEQEAEETAVLTKEEGSNLEAAVKVEAEESESTSSTGEAIQISSVKNKSDSETRPSLMQEETAYTKEEIELTPQMPEEIGHDDHRCQMDTVCMKNVYGSSAASECDNTDRSLGEDVEALVMLASKLQHPFLMQDESSSSEALEDTTKEECGKETAVKSELVAASDSTEAVCDEETGTKSLSEVIGEALGDQKIVLSASATSLGLSTDKDNKAYLEEAMDSMDHEGSALEPSLEANTNEASDARDHEGLALESTLEAHTNEASDARDLEGSALESTLEATLESTLEAITNEDDPPASTGGAVDHIQDLAPAARKAPGREWNEEEKKLLEENKKLREMLERLLKAGKQQLGVISDLNVRVKDLEKKLSQKKKTRVRRHKVVKCPPATKVLSSAS